ncbi:MAG: STAS domain-containing protein [Treponema sp.]|jgi:anti-anti-sigma factor|nr:STAS domain-containing protein [Treponema sp.]
MGNNDIVSGFDDEKDESLKIRLEKVSSAENCLLLALTGYIDTYNSTHFQKRVQKAIDAGFHKLIFQCESLSYISSTGIGSFTVFLKAVKSQDGDIVLLNIQPKVSEVFQLLGFSQFFSIKNSLNDAVHSLDSGAAHEKPSAFPRLISCPICSKEQKIVKKGRFRCHECKTILVIDETGHSLL